MVASPRFRVVNALERAWGPRRHQASKRSTSKRQDPWRQQTIGRSTASASYQQAQGVSKKSGSSQNRKLAVSASKRRSMCQQDRDVSKQYQQVRRQQSIGSSAVSANLHLRSTHSCRKSGSRRGHLHTIYTQHMRTVTHHSNSRIIIDLSARSLSRIIIDLSAGGLSRFCGLLGAGLSSRRLFRIMCFRVYYFYTADFTAMAIIWAINRYFSTKLRILKLINN